MAPPSIPRDDNYVASVQAKLRLIGLVSRLSPFCQISTLPYSSSSSSPRSLPSFLLLHFPSCGWHRPTDRLTECHSRAAFAPDCAHRARKFPLFLIARVINSARSDGNPDAAPLSTCCLRLRIRWFRGRGYFVINMRRDRHHRLTWRDFNAHLCRAELRCFAR